MGVKLRRKVIFKLDLEDVIETATFLATLEEAGMELPDLTRKMMTYMAKRATELLPIPETKKPVSQKKRRRSGRRNRHGPRTAMIRSMQNPTSSTWLAIEEEGNMDDLGMDGPEWMKAEEDTVCDS